MAIYLIDRIKQANNGTYALIDSNDIAGGLYHVDTVAEMNTLPVERLKEGMLCYVSEQEKFYKYNKSKVFVEWNAGFDKSESIAELGNKTIIASIIENSNAIEELQSQLETITGQGNGNATTIEGINAQLNSLKQTVGTASVDSQEATGLIKRIEDLESTVATEVTVATEQEILAIIDSL